MNQIIEKGTPHEKAEIIDFINYVFSQAHAPHDFKTLIPKVYGDDADGLGAEHYLIREDGMIKALVADRFFSLSVAQTVLRVGLIGSVSVHPYSRGKGYMKELMPAVIDDARNSGTDLLVLGGQRQRYGYFGFESAGTQLRFRITKDNIRHCMSNLDCTEISFVDLDNHDTDSIRFAKKLYERNPLHALRDEKEFSAIMQTWNTRCRIVYRNGERIGYCYGNCWEVEVIRESDFPAVLKALFAQENLNETDIRVSPFRTERASFLYGICEEAGINQVEMIHVLNWRTVLQGFLSLKAAYTRLEDGTEDFEIDGKGYCVSVTDGRPTVCETEIRSNARKFSHVEAERAFFGIDLLLLDERKIHNWAPLPFNVDVPDTF